MVHRQTAIEDVYALSPMQQGMLYHTLRSPGSALYVEQHDCTLTGLLDPASFIRAWERVVERHAALRTLFLWEGLESPVQVVCRRVSVPVQQLDWRGLDEAEQRRRWDTLVEADRQQGFALDKAPLMRLTLAQIGDQQYEFLWTHHHIVLDGWSLPLLLKEVFRLYEAYCRSEELTLPPAPAYRDYILWLQRQDAAKAEAFWRRQLAGFTEPTRLGVERSATAAPEGEKGACRQTLTAAHTAALQAFARRHRLTLNTLVQGAWAILLSRYSGNDDVVFGATVSGRSADVPGIESLLGLCINTLPLRVRVDGGESLLPWLQRLQELNAEVRQYEYSPLVDVQRWSDVPRGQPLFENILVFENYPIGGLFASSQGRGRLEVSDLRVYGQSDQTLVLNIDPGDSLQFNITYHRGRYEDETARRMLGHVAQLLDAMVADPETRLADLPLITADERRQILEEWNDTAAPYACQELVHELFQAQAARTPDAVAVVFEGERVTYSELNRRANRLANYLLAQGVGPDVPVALCLERSVDMVAAILSVLKAGGAYVPLDPEYPAERLAFMLEDAAPKLLLTQSRLLSRLPANYTGDRVCLDEEWDRIETYSDADPPRRASAFNLAYLIYTSGSTGRPKGVMSTHGGLLNRIVWMQNAFGLNASDRVLQKTPFSFDVSVWEFLWPLAYGARLVVAKPGGHRDPAYTAHLIHSESITTAHFVPAMLQAFLEYEATSRLAAGLKRVICSGEALPESAEKKFFELLPGELHNLYGPTEASIDVTSWQCHAEDTGAAPIGRPIANTQAYVLDREFEPAPVGVPGELFLGGVGLARGYWRRSGLTAERFLPDPFSNLPGARMYRTGDLARYRSDSNLEFLGRIDHQVKIRGLRIELGEIEALLRDHPGVRGAVVGANAVDGADPGEKQLVAYVVSTEASPSVSDLRGYLAQRLPEYMIPAGFVFLAELPLNANGKIDRKALPAAEARPSESCCFVAPRTSVEQILADMWQQLLHIDRAGIYDNFFESGGHSLLMTQMASRIEQEFGVTLSLRELFDAPTIVDITILIAEHQCRQQDPDELARILREIESLHPKDVEQLQNDTTTAK